MTQAELNDLPEWQTEFGAKEHLINGKLYMVPVLSPQVVLWTNEDEPCATIDINGQRWRIGWHKGVCYKRKVLCTE
jgi:hypothetical protein